MANADSTPAGGVQHGNGSTIYVLRSAVVAAVSSLLFAFDAAVISGATGALREVFNLSETLLGFTVSSALVGTILGSIIVARPADVYGRRNVLVVLTVIYVISAVGTALAWDWWSFLFFRFIGGVSVGGGYVLAPLYISEIAPARMRGRLVGITQFNIVVGINLAYVSNLIIAQLNLGATEWRWMFGVEAFPACALLLLLYTVPDSPRWLVAKGRNEEARAVLSRTGTDTGNVDTEIAEIQRSLFREEHTPREPLFQRKYRGPILLAIVIAMFNQLSGINSLMFYAPDIFRLAGAGRESALAQSVAVGVTLLVFTLAALLVIDKVGRRFLMIIGSIGYIVSLTTTAAAFYVYGTDFTHTGGLIVLGALLLFIASHAFGQGCVIWVFISEVFPNTVRARGQALGTFTHWIMAAAISWTFPVIAEASGGHAFSFYAVMMVLQLIWVLTIMPETKGVPLEQIQAKLGITESKTGGHGG